MAIGENPKEISGLFDIYDDSVRGAVSYEPWLGSNNIFADRFKVRDPLSL